VRQFVKAARMDFPRFTDDAAAKAEGLPGALVLRGQPVGLSSVEFDDGGAE